MGGLLARVAARSGASVTIANRSAERARSLAASIGAGTTELDPGPGIGRFDAILVALGGPWTIGATTEAAILDRRPAIVDLSVPSAVPAGLAAGLGSRLVTADDLALHERTGIQPGSRRRGAHRRAHRPDGPGLPRLAGTRRRALGGGCPGPSRGSRARGRARGPVAAAAGARSRGARGDRGDDAAPRRPPASPAAGAPRPRFGRHRRPGRPGPVRAVNGDRIAIGSRGSALALAQARLVSEALERDGRRTRVVIVETEGDRRAPDTAWGEGAFVAAIERALLDGRVDVAVHSAKDVPIEQDARLRIAAYLPRADPRDALVVRADATEHSLVGPQAGHQGRHRQPAAGRLHPRPTSRPRRAPAPRQRRHPPASPGRW